MSISSSAGGTAGLVACFGYLVQAIIGSIRPQTETFSRISDYIHEVIFIVALVATLIALIGLHSFVQSR